VSGDPQERLGVGRRPAVEREGDLAAHIAQSVADTIDLRGIHLHDLALDGGCRRNVDVILEQLQQRPKRLLLDDREWLIAEYYPYDNAPPEFF
jgi:hypothetical protein